MLYYIFARRRGAPLTRTASAFYSKILGRKTWDNFRERYSYSIAYSPFQINRIVKKRVHIPVTIQAARFRWNRTVDTDLNRDGDATDPGKRQAAAASATWTKTISKRLPSTGFAPHVITDTRDLLPEAYSQAGSVSIEIPVFIIDIPVVGVPKKNGTRNVSWLGDQAGWLEGSAFPSWNGNSVLTGHVYLASGLPGPFVSLNNLKYGDRIIVHAYGKKYTFAVQTNAVVGANDATVMKHEEKPWLTLVTCRDYDEKTATYLNRVVVRAVLVRVDWE